MEKINVQSLDGLKVGGLVVHLKRTGSDMWITLTEGKRKVAKVCLDELGRITDEVVTTTPVDVPGVVEGLRMTSAQSLHLVAVIQAATRSVRIALRGDVEQDDGRVKINGETRVVIDEGNVYGDGKWLSSSGRSRMGAFKLEEVVDHQVMLYEAAMIGRMLGLKVKVPDVV